MSTFQASNLFTTPPTSFLSVLSITFSIFALEWKTYVKLAAFYFLSVIAVSITVGAIAATILGISMPNSMQNILPVGTMTRNLLDYAPGMSGTSRLLQYYSDEDTSLPMVPYYDIPQNLVSLVIAFTLVLVILFIYVESIFIGGFTYTTGEVYSGNTPSYKKSMQVALSKQLKVFEYNLTVTGVFLLIGALLFFLPMKEILRQVLVDPTNNVDMDEITPKLCIFGSITILIYLSLATFLIAVIPAIILEKKTPIEACKRSFQICGDYYFFLFFSVLGYIVLFILFSSITNEIFDALGAIGVIGHLTVNLIATGINAIFPIVLYMSIRTQNEELTQESFAREIGSVPTNTSLPIAQAIETDALIGNNSQGNYSSVQTETNDVVV
ncbi:hypothetical protein CTEN210_11958 [Chaetoceros tenuissimus]|uniref:Uncharacterized protein n=1 Tax=Chaetoceros tenuissimus TaxID=426638 RepID=A0AAD3D0A1_9STRA|nr:hypothetical protein CTEN210_11958 [Chaetoceros tenuissimus]